MTDQQQPNKPTSATQQCPTCGHANRPGILFCENCGTDLLTGRKPNLGTRDLRDQPQAKVDVSKPQDANPSVPAPQPPVIFDPKQTIAPVDVSRDAQLRTRPAEEVARMIQEALKPQMVTSKVGDIPDILNSENNSSAPVLRETDHLDPSVLQSGEAKAIQTAGSTIFTDDMVLRIEIEGGATPIILQPKQEMVFGRRDPATGAMPDVDMTPYAGYRMGVSRRHAAIRYQDRRLDLWDLGSSNGTFLQGVRLNAHRPYQIRDGDEVRLGQMVLKLYFQSGSR